MLYWHGGDMLGDINMAATTSSRAIDLTGQTFNRLTVLYRAPKDPTKKARDARWVCECSCENHTIVIVAAGALKSGSIKSCGCLHQEYIHSEEQLKRLASTVKLVHQPGPIRDKWIASMKATRNKPEVKEQMSRTGKEIWTRPGFRENQVEKQSGKKQSPETIQKKIAATTGQKRTPETCANISKSLMGKLLSEEHRKSLQVPKPGSQGEKHHNWKGGITELNGLIRSCFKSKEWIRQVFSRDNFRCTVCGKKGKKILRAHHIKFFSHIIQDNNIQSLEEALECEELWDITNGITLCQKHHIELHARLRQENPEEGSS